VQSGSRFCNIQLTMMMHQPNSSAHTHGIARPGRDAPPQQIAEYYQRMLVADGAIPSLSFSPFEPPVAGALALDARGESADYFYGRQAPRGGAGRTAANPFEPDAFSPPGDYIGHEQYPAPRAFAQAGDLASMLFGPRPSTAGPTEDDLITAHLEEVRQAECELMASLRITPEEDEALIREQARLLVSAQRTAAPLGAPSTPVHSDAKAAESVAAAEDLAPSAVATDELEAALAASRATSEAESDAELQRALELSTTSQSVGEGAPAASPESAEAGIDIPFETPKSLLDAVVPEAAATSKAARAKSKRGKGKGSNV